MLENILKPVDLAKKATEELLENLWKDRGYPVDPVTIANKLGIQVLQTVLPKSVLGAILKAKHKDPVIVVRSDDSESRKRFTCAHELGHYIHRFYNDQIGESFNWIDFRDLTPDAENNPDEIFANKFAENLLMPEKELKNQIKKMDKILLSLHFGVSDESLGKRLANLNLSE